MRIRMPEYKWQIFFVTGLANITVTTSLSGINLALPIMADEFGVSMSAISWLSLVYTLVPSCTLLIFGRAADLFGYKRQFVAGFLVFAASSALLPLAVSGLAGLILFRCIQAMGYAMLISITQAMCNRTFPANERGRALGINAIFVSLGLSIGPSVSGFLLSHFSWHSIFFFCVPFSILGAVVSVIILKKDEPNQASPRRMDWLGSLFFVIFIGLIVFAINFSAEWGLASVNFLGCILVGVISLLLFIRRETRTDMPLMKLTLFRNPVFSFANGASICSYILQQMNTFLMPFFLMNILLIPSANSGFIMLATPVAMMLMSPIGGRLTDRRGAAIPALTGLGAFALACIMMSTLSEATPVFFVIIALIFFGAGNGLSATAINSSIFSAAPRNESGVASGVVATVRNLGQSLGVAIGGAVMAIRQSHYYARAAEASAEIPEGNGIYLLAQRDAFFVGVCVVAVAIVCMSLIRSKKTEQL